MISSKKNCLRKVLKGIIIFILIFIVASMTATKFIYDYIFKRYDSLNSENYPGSIVKLVNSREILKYKSGENNLQGYYYKSSSTSDALVIIAPGFNAGADNYLQQTQSFIEQGFDVFAFDNTGCKNSEGDSNIGFPQAICDLDATLSYIEGNDRFNYHDIYLFGHSRGGYAVCCVLGYNHDITAVVSVAGINSAMEAIMEPSVKAIGNSAYINYPFLWFYQTTLFGNEIANKTATEEISNSDIPVLIIHGKNDTKISSDEYSIYSHKDEITGNAQFLLYEEENQDGHTSILYDEDGSFNKELMDIINLFYVNNKGD